MLLKTFPDARASPISARKMLALGSRVAAGTGFLVNSTEEKKVKKEENDDYTERMLNINMSNVICEDLQ